MSDWQTVPLGAVAVIERDGVHPDNVTEDTIYVGLEHIETGGKFLNPPPVGTGLLASTKFRFTARHILYGKLRPYLGIIACPDFQGICSTDIVPILPGERVDRRFLYHFLRQPAMVAKANSRAVGMNRPRLSPTVLSKFVVPLPPIAEQRRITDVLDRAEALRAKRRAALGQLDSLTQAVFVEMFGDFGRNSKKWPVYPVSEYVSEFQGGKVWKQRVARVLLPATEY